MDAFPVRREVVLEASAIADILSDNLTRNLDGRKIIPLMRDAKYTNWRQSEWIGFFYEWEIENLLIAQLGGQRGPTYGKTTFDYQKNLVWDSKAHSLRGSGGSVNSDMTLNDCEAMARCINAHSGVGFIVVSGNAYYDRDGLFKTWHNDIKGGKSKYVQERIARGVGSRPLKTGFIAKYLDILFFESIDALESGFTEGWLRPFQEGMRNANGSPRRQKYNIRLEKIPEWARPIPRILL